MVFHRVTLHPAVPHASLSCAVACCSLIQKHADDVLAQPQILCCDSCVKRCYVQPVVFRLGATKVCDWRRLQFDQVLVDCETHALDVVPNSLPARE